MKTRSPLTRISAIAVGLVLMALAIVSTTTPAAAGTVFECGRGTANPVCPGTVKVSDRKAGVRYECGFGTSNPICPGSVRSNDRMLAPAPSDSDTAPATAHDPEAIHGDWSLGAGGFILSAPSGPSAYGVEATFAGDLKIDEGWYFHLSGSPGLAFVDGDVKASLSETAGIQRRWSSFSLTGGGRHRVAFLNGDAINSVLGDIQLRLFVSNSVSLGLSGGPGYAWFSSMKAQPGLFPAGAEVPLIGKADSGFAWDAALAIEVQF